MNKAWEAIGNKLKGLPDEVSALVTGWSSDEESDKMQTRQSIPSETNH